MRDGGQIVFCFFLFKARCRMWRQSVFVWADIFRSSETKQCAQRHWMETGDKAHGQQNNTQAHTHTHVFLCRTREHTGHS